MTPVKPQHLLLEWLFSMTQAPGDEDNDDRCGVCICCDPSADKAVRTKQIQWVQCEIYPISILIQEHNYCMCV